MSKRFTETHVADVHVLGQMFMADVKIEYDGDDWVLSEITLVAIYQPFAATSKEDLTPYKNLGAEITFDADLLTDHAYEALREQIERDLRFYEPDADDWYKDASYDR